MYNLAIAFRSLLFFAIMYAVLLFMNLLSLCEMHLPRPFNGQFSLFPMYTIFIGRGTVEFEVNLNLCRNLHSDVET